jgi:response regulator RpfG family c-di-GMP phosphodiesterase
MNRKILIVDDDSNVLSGFKRSLRNRYDLDTATSGGDALQKVRGTGPYAVIVADMQMPGLSGLDLLMKVETLAPDSVRVILTGNADQKTAVDAVNRGHVFRFLNKPCASDSLIAALEAGLRQYSLVTAERELLERTLNGTIRLLTEILSSFYPESFGRCEKVLDSVRVYARASEFRHSWELEAATLLAPIGYLTVPPSLLDKFRSDQTLSAAEQDLLGRLPDIGANLLAHIPRLEEVAAIVRYQHKEYDGLGPPADGAVGERIPIGARILKVLSDLAILEPRAGGKAEALALMRKRPGTYDPQVLESVIACFGVSPPTSRDSQSATRPRSLRDLSVGQVLAANVETVDGILVISAGAELTNMVLHRLRNFAELNPVKEPIYTWE